MKVLVCGSRDYINYKALNCELDLVHQSPTPITLIIEGEAPGADTIALQWARSNNVPVMQCPADWKTYGRGAGPKRNSYMLKEGKPDRVLAFLNKPLSESKGTHDMVKKANRRGIPVTIFINP